MPSQREFAAYHEGSHAIVALAFGGTVRSASIKPRGASRGRVIRHGTRDDAADLSLFLTLARPFAHRRFAPRSNWLTSDFAIVEKMIFGKESRGTAANKEKYL